MGEHLPSPQFEPPPTFSSMADPEEESLLGEEGETWSLLRRGPPPPPDRFNRVYFVFYLLGLGTLLPWNFFITVNSFWDYKFRNVTANDTSDEEDQTELQTEFTSYLSIASNVPNAIFVIVNAIYGHNFKLSFRIFTSLGSIIGFFLVITVFAKVDSDGWQIPFLYTILTIVVLININTAVFQGGLFGVAGKFPSKYMGSVMAGQAMGGILPALVDIIVLSLDISERDSGFACFTIATLILIMNFALFAWLIRTDFFRHYARDHDDLLPHPEDEHSVIVQHHISFWHILSHSWHYCLSVYLVFTVTLSVFPAVTVLIESHEKSPLNPTPWTDLYFVPVTCLLLFNVGDYVGRTLSSWIQMPGRTKVGRAVVIVASLARIVFVPMFMYCNVAPTKRELPVLFPNDADFIVLMILFSVTNGYIGNICMMNGPKTVVSCEEQEVAAMILVACLVLGTGSGALLSYPIVSML